MKRDIVTINEDLCDGCGLCIPNCHEGALQIIDNKARLVSDLMCDGLGACIGHCPQEAISIEKREAKPYDEIKVMSDMVKKGKSTVVAHLKHLKDHDESKLVKQGIKYLIDNEKSIDFSVNDVIKKVHKSKPDGDCHSGGCPGSAEKEFVVPETKGNETPLAVPSQLKHWPVQLHLANPAAGFFHGADVVIAADCTAFTYGNFHAEFIKDKSLVIACPKLDSGLGTYVEKIRKMIDEAKVNTLTVVIMEVPCCGGLIQIVKKAVDEAQRKVPVKQVIIGIQGKIQDVKWI
ncbi:MAG: 4Fe-4S binding protein [Candidatus Delongbacteria bacterium]|jgi:ferredoxin|nr:4Fe-4S binding protein [Candidatus Delongbacteria bacterium]